MAEMGFPDVEESKKKQNVGNIRLFSTFTFLLNANVLLWLKNMRLSKAVYIDQL